ncbi:hypothetical protein DFH09DRAFT_1413161 [Mycena vulgaris]|nr:hypothetical protein DFH09DRAFT_1413161 [Mycena vulgaris]
MKGRAKEEPRKGMERHPLSLHRFQCAPPFPCYDGDHAEGGGAAQRAERSGDTRPGVARAPRWSCSLLPFPSYFPALDDSSPKHPQSRALRVFIVAEHAPSCPHPFVAAIAERGEAYLEVTAAGEDGDADNLLLVAPARCSSSSRARARRSELSASEPSSGTARAEGVKERFAALLLLATLPTPSQCSSPSKGSELGKGASIVLRIVLASSFAPLVSVALSSTCSSATRSSGMPRRLIE